MKDFKGVFDGPVSVCWTLLKFPCNLFGLTYDLARAGNMNEFKSGVSQIISPGLNVIYGDSAGNIAWYSAGKLVKRPAGIPNSLVLDGSDSATEWQGYYGFDDNPKSENPPCGFVYSCNHQPDTIHGIFHQGYYLTDERARRLSELLKAKDKYNLEDLERIVYDHRNPELQKIVSSLFALTTTSVQEQETVARSASRLLHEWKGTHETDESAPVIYYMWLYKSLHDCMADELGEENFLAFLKTHTVKYSIQPLLKNDTAKWWDDVRTPEKENARDIVSHAFEETVSTLSGQFGKDVGSWKWGDMHKLEFVHPVGKKKPMNLLFNVGPFAAAGGIETIDNQSFTLTDKFPATVMFGPALRRCIDFAKPLDALNVLPSGQSGNPMSRHYNDQAEMYVSGHFRKDLMNEQEIKSNCKEVLVFK
jgi:penicillin amidase